MVDYYFADLPLARRLERAEAHSNAAFVEARARVAPESGATWLDVGGTYAMYDGVGSPVTQTFGLGLFDPVTVERLEQLERFFRDRGAAVHHEVSPLAPPALLTTLSARGYYPVEFTSVLARPIGPAPTPAAHRDERIQVRAVRPGEHARWAEVAARGWADSAELNDFLLAMGAVYAEHQSAVTFFAEVDGDPIAAAVLGVHEGVALLAGASTVPEARKRGAQLALLEARLRHAAANGCDIAMMGAAPGSASQRNAERQGFRIAYTRIKWRRQEERT